MGLHRGGEVGLDADAVAVHHAADQAFLDRHRLGAHLPHRVVLVLEQRDERLKRVVVRRAAREDQVLGGFQFIFRDRVQRHDLRHVQDRGGHPRLGRVVEVDRVQHVPRGGLQAERDVRQAEADLALGQFGVDRCDRLQGFEAEAAVVRVAGADGEGERIEDQIRRGQAMLDASELVQPLGDAELVRRELGHADFVDGERHHRRAVFARELQAFFRLVLAVLEVDRVDDRLAAVELERRLDHLGVGGVDHQRRIDGAAQARNHLGHVGEFLAADEGGADVERVRAFLDLLARHAEDAVPIFRILELAEFLRAVGVAALADREDRVLLAQRHLAVERGDGGHPMHAALHRHGAEMCAAHALQHRVDRGDVLGPGAAAAADQIHAVLGDEASVPVGEFLGCEGIHGLAVHQLGQARVRLHRDQARPVLRQPFHMLRHFRRAGGAVEAEAVDVEGMQRGRGGGDVGADEERAGGLHRHLHHDRQLRAALGVGDLRAVDRRLDLQRVLAGLDQERIRATRDQSLALHRECGFEGIVVDMPKGRQLGARSDRADDEALAAVGKTFRRFPRDLGGALVDLEGAVRQAELAQRHRRAAEGVGLDAVGAGGEVAAMDVADHVRAGENQHLGAVLLPHEVHIHGQIQRLHQTAHAAVAQQHAL